jgi:allophanate hydrolase subunit 1
MLVRQVGTSAVLLEIGEPSGDTPAAGDPLAWHAELVRRRAAGELTAVDLVPGAATVLIDGVPDPAALTALLPTWAPADPDTTDGVDPGTGIGTTVGVGPEAGSVAVAVPVRYTGEDLPEVAALWGCDVATAIHRLATTELTVAFCGFAPGFAYLRGLPGTVPRLATPRPRVPAGAVGLAGRYAGIYPAASPGGWRIVGYTDRTLFDQTADPPALLQPGARVRLPAAS